MVKFLKMYVPMIFSLMFFVIYTSLIGIMYNELMESSVLIPYFMMSCVIIILCLVEWIYFVIKAARSREADYPGLWAILIYFFNFFIIPYYNFKYVVKTAKLKLNMVIYVILLIISCFSGFFTSSVFASNIDPEVLYLYSDDERIRLRFTGDYEERKVGDYDLYVSDYTRNINVGVFIYTNEDDTTAEEIMDYRDVWIYNTRDNVYVVDSYTDTVDDAKITSTVYYGELDGSSYIYQISTVEFDSLNYIVNTIHITFEEDYDKYKEEFKRMLLDVKLMDV